MSYVDPTTTGTASGAAATATAASASKSGLNQLDNTQTFLNLLVAQLKNQNPDNPTDPTSFMTEIAQMTAVQSQTTLNAEEQTVAADSMIGKSVSGNDSAGAVVSGVVTGVTLSSSGPPELQLAAPAGSTGAVPSVALDAVTRVYQATTAATTPAATGSNPSNPSTSTSPSTTA